MLRGNQNAIRRAAITRSANVFTLPRVRCSIPVVFALFSRSSPKSCLNRNSQMPVGRESTEPIKKMAAQERQERLAKEREEIAARVASFRATQEKFQREREEFFERTWRDIHQAESQPFWS